MEEFQPLADTRVLDMSWLVPGPYATCLLGDLGADIVKIERPETGDYLRSLYAEPGRSAQRNTFFDMLNRNKRSITLNLKSDRGTDLFYELAAEADVVIEAYSPGTAADLGVDFETVQEHNPDIIYCSVTGYGQTGPYKDLPGHDINYQAISGIAGLAKPSDGGPPIPGTTIGDLCGGVYSCLAILAALQQESAQYIDVSMADVLTTWTLPHIFEHFAGTSTGNQTRHQRAPSYGYYETGDSKYVSIAAVEDKFWKRLCDALDIQEYVEAHRSEDPAERQAVRERLEEVFQTRTRDEWVTYLVERGVPCSPVQELEEVEDSEQVTARDLLFSEEGFGPQFRFPVHCNPDVDDRRSPPPDLGEHTDEILSELGVSAAERKSLREDGVL